MLYGYPQGCFFHPQPVPTLKPVGIVCWKMLDNQTAAVLQLDPTLRVGGRSLTIITHVILRGALA
jgi:hypothetical protein